MMNFLLVKFIDGNPTVSFVLIHFSVVGEHSFANSLPLGV